MIIGDWDGHQVVIKSLSRYSRFFNSIRSTETFSISTKAFYTMIRDTLENIGIRPPLKGQDLMNAIWSEDVNMIMREQGTANARSTALQNIYFLLQQDEYLYMKFFEHVDVFPKIMGTCGHFYATEYAPPGRVLGQNTLFATKGSWRERATIAMRLLNLLRHLEYSLPEPFHMCDIKGENFGITFGGAVKAIDVDMGFFDHAFSRVMNSTKCHQHADCAFGDCKALCNFSRQHCTPRRSNNNLQVILYSDIHTS